MFHVVLYQPEIPPNTGNIIRLCANSGTRLHLIHPLGFSLDDSKLRRAGLDYREWAEIREYPDWTAFLEGGPSVRLFAISTRGNIPYTQPVYRDSDGFLFGPETRGLPTPLLGTFPPQHRLHIPMMPGNRSLNLSNAVAIVVFEAWRQQDFPGALR
ncbi:tRNA (cytidine/uridine-2'-O)-ribose methyltransferase [Gammaproteobacteria bacterium]